MKLIMGLILAASKNTDTKKSPIVCPHSYDIPLGIMQKYNDVTLSVVIMHVNGIPFLNNISQLIKFISAGRLDNIII